MKYFEFLALFLVPPIILLIGLYFRNNLVTRAIYPENKSFRRWRSVALVSFIAVIYTTPWDNFLVANRVWYYDPALVTGMVLAWVPVEEYIFFVLQTILTGTLTFLLTDLKSLKIDDAESTRGELRGVSGWVAVASLIAVITGFFFHWEEGTYLLLLLIWALPPIALQLFFGADILCMHRRLIILSIFAPTIYLSLADSLAISSGTWIINSEKSLGLFIGALPVEEILFFFVTNTLIVLAITLMNSSESQYRLGGLAKNLRKVYWRQSRL